MNKHQLMVAAILAAFASNLDRLWPRVEYFLTSRAQLLIVLATIAGVFVPILLELLKRNRNKPAKAKEARP